MKLPEKLQKGFSFDEALSLSNLCKRAYDIFQYDDGNIYDIELHEIYNSINRKAEEWNFVSSIRNDETNVRALIVKNPTAHQYALAFRGTILTDRGSWELTDILADTNWELGNYGFSSDKSIKVGCSIVETYESVGDQIRIFFKTLLGKLKLKDFQELKKRSPERQFLCASSMADAGSIRLPDGEFESGIRKLLEAVVEDGEIGNNDELEPIFEYLQNALLNLEKPDDSIEVYIAGHSLGGALCFFCALDLQRSMGSELDIKVYTIGAPKPGNQAFADYYNRQMSEGVTYRIENLLDTVPQIPPPLPFPVSAFVGSGLRIGSVYLANTSPVGEVHTVMGLGSQSVSIDFGGALEFLGGVPFPHSPETYIQLLEEDRQRLKGFFRPIRDTLGGLVKELLEEQQAELKADTKKQIQSLERKIDALKSDIESLKNSG